MRVTLGGQQVVLHAWWQPLSEAWYLLLHTRGEEPIALGRQVATARRLVEAPSVFSGELVVVPLERDATSIGREAWGRTHGAGLFGRGRGGSGGLGDMTQYLRQVKVEIESSDRTVLIVEQLRVVFDLRSEKQSSTSPSTVKIYNLGRASASHIAERGQVVRVTGDIGNADSLFEGEIRRVLHERSGLDRITTVVLGGSDSALSGAAVSLSLPGRVGLREVVKRIVKVMGLQIGTLDVVPDETFEEGYYYNGSAKTALTRLLEPRGVTSYEAAGMMLFARRGAEVPVGESLLTERTGLIGSPSVTEDDGVRAKMALNGSIELDQVVEIQSEALNRRFVVNSVVHRGDNWGGGVRDGDRGSQGRSADAGGSQRVGGACGGVVTSMNRDTCVSSAHLGQLMGN